MIFLSIEYTVSTVVALILVPLLSVLLIIVIVALAFSGRRTSGLVTSQVYMNKAAALVDGDRNYEDIAAAVKAAETRKLSQKEAKKLAAYIGKAQFEAETPGEERDLTPFTEALNEAHKLALALFDAERSDGNIVAIIRRDIEKAQNHLQEKCGVDRNVSNNFKAASKAQKRKEANKFLDGYK